MLMVTNGIIAGIGIGLTVLPCPVAIGYAFPKHSGIAMGITTSAIGVGMLVSGPITQHLLNTYGLRGTFLLSAGIASHVLPCALLLNYSQVKERKAAQNTNRHKHFKTYISLLHSPSYMCVLIGAILWNISYAIIMIHLPSYVVHTGSSREQASFMFTVIGIGTIVSRLTIGLAIGPEGLDPLLLNFGLTAFVGTLIITFPLYITFSFGPLIFASLYGIYSGGLLVFTVPLCLEMAGTDRLTSAVGLWFFLLGLGSLTGPPIAGLVLDVTGSYKYSYILSGLFVLLASGFSLLASIWRESKDEKLQSTEFSLSPMIKEADDFEKVNFDDVLSSREQGVKLLSNNT
ncbi:monocarboxylate transporter 13-like isoform X2 [Saccostrea echinata]|nr:monocarboxylate transporter 13-like isoform X2 [Saccostrea echinata]